MDGVAEKPPVAIEEPEVDAPTVDADRVQPADVPPGFSQTVEDGAVKPEDVPVQHPVNGYGPIPEPRHLLQMKLLVPHDAEDRSAA